MIKINAPKHWVRRNEDGEYITDPEITSLRDTALQVRFLQEGEYRKLLRVARAAEAYLTTLAWGGRRGDAGALANAIDLLKGSAPDDAAVKP